MPAAEPHHLRTSLRRLRTGLPRELSSGDTRRCTAAYDRLAALRFGGIHSAATLAEALDRLTARGDRFRRLMIAHGLPALAIQAVDAGPRETDPPLPRPTELAADPGPVSRLLLAYGMTAARAGWRMSVVVKPNRILPVLADAARSGASRPVFAVLTAMLTELAADPARRGLQDALTLAADCTAAEAVRTSVPALDTHGLSPPRPGGGGPAGRDPRLLNRSDRNRRRSRVGQAVGPGPLHEDAFAAGRASGARTAGAGRGWVWAHLEV
ncbi:hypothetical protein [Kitasatospora purpeofusca]|uniref:hypothetical protein n=1 Tax=Kitasatospora purpeofusca TaxID=67352 RepID=UPI0036D408CC